MLHLKWPAVFKHSNLSGCLRVRGGPKVYIWNNSFLGAIDCFLKVNYRILKLCNIVHLRAALHAGQLREIKMVASFDFDREDVAVDKV